MAIQPDNNTLSTPPLESPSFGGVGEAGAGGPDIILKAENISKQYRLGQVGTGTLSHDLNRWWHQVRGKKTII